MAPKTIGIGLTILLAAASVAFILNNRQSVNETEVHEDDTDAGTGRVQDDAGLVEIVAKREKLDETVWSDEVMAQKFEEPFIDLWDTLRASEDKIADLAEFTFQDLTFEMPGEPTRHDHMIDTFHCNNGTTTLDSAEWQSWLNDWKQSGLRIIQTEWHHSRFEPHQDTPQSVVSFVLDLVNSKEKAYYTVKGKLEVDWNPISTSANQPQARSIVATDVTILSRRADPIFEEATVLKIAATTTRRLLIANDVDGDGLSELISPGDNALFRNRGNFQFEPQRLFDFPPGENKFTGAMGDFTGDGRADFLGSDVNGAVFLYVADEDRRFSTPPRTVLTASDIRNPTVITAGDIDADGDLDVWIGQYKPPYVGGQMPTPYYDANDGLPAYLLRNDGDGNLHDLTEANGLAGKRNRRTYSASFVDLDNDLDLDLVVVSDFSGVDVYTNDGKGHFSDITDERVSNRHAFGMSLSISDYNSDSELDFFMTGMSSTTAKRLHQMGLGLEEFDQYQSARPEMGYGNRLYLADGENFNQAEFNDQVARTGWSWGSTSFDFDNDGDRDIFVANGHQSRSTAKDYCTQFWCHDIYTGTSDNDQNLSNFFNQNRDLSFGKEGISWNGFEHNKLLMNQDGAGFLGIEFLAGVASELDSRNVISDDLNGDGRVDLVVLSRAPISREPTIHVLQNKNDSDANWIGIRLENTSRSGLGARVMVKTADGNHVAAVVAGDSYVSQHAPVVHFGLGSTTQVDEVTITWPDGASATITQPDINRYHLIQSNDIVVPAGDPTP